MAVPKRKKSHMFKNFKNQTNKLLFCNNIPLKSYRFLNDNYKINSHNKVKMNKIFYRLHQYI
jgi:hypothetical protein